ncbi:MAG: M18 family aminopeptidase [Erysipelotrichaceae bacterium]|nr:M18 family aminopeptidase [Erysipelotrichaceae bacterium]
MNCENLIQFLSSSPTAWHAVDTVKNTLTENGYAELKESEKWQIEPCGKYFVRRNDSSLIAFEIPEKGFAPFMAAAAHTDSPSFRIKPHPEMKGSGAVRINTEGYGGMLCHPWFDRPLSCAGRIMVKTENGFESRLFKSEQDLFMIPSLAIHMNRGVNENTSLNKQKDLMPLFAMESKEEIKLYDVIAKEAGIKSEDIIDSDLLLYVREEPRVWGAKKEFISGPHLDDLYCAWGLTNGMIAADNSNAIKVLALFDNEEVGSLTKQGAYSTFFYDTLKRISISMGKDEEDFLMALAESFLVSADNAHAVHPNYPEKIDPTNQPKINSGIVIKFNGNQKYTSDAFSASVMRSVCEKAGVPVQEFVNRSDMAGGSTLGNLSNVQVSLNAVDIGLAQLAMHSCYETAGVQDGEYLVNAMKCYYGSAIRKNGNRIELL